MQTVDVKFCSLGWPPVVLTIPMGSTLGDAVLSYLEARPSAIDNTLFIGSRQKTLGSDVSLSQSITENISIISVPEYVGMAGDLYAIKRPVNAYKSNQSWPPCVNFYDVEPINGRKICYLEPSERRGNPSDAWSIRNPDECNWAENMIILAFGPDPKDRVAYNKHALLKWIKTCLDEDKELTDPLSRRPISVQATLDIMDSQGDFEVINVV